MTMSDARKKQGAKKHGKKKAKKGAGPKIVQEIVESKNDQMKPDKMEKMIVEEPPQSVEKNIPHPKSKKGKKRKLVSSEEKMDTSISEKKASTGGGGNEQLGEKLERMDDDGSPSEKKKKKKPRKPKLGKLDENEDDTTSEMKDVSNISEEGKTELGGEKPLSKRKGKNKQRKKKKNKNKQASTELQVNTARFCLRYLELWDKDRASWHFQKVRQVWLLKHMYDKTKVPKSEFHILLRYLENIQGNAREITVKYAEALIEKLEDKIQNLSKEEKSSDGEEEEDGDEKKKMKIQWRRASDILQTLS